VHASDLLLSRAIFPPWLLDSLKRTGVKQRVSWQTTFSRAAPSSYVRDDRLKSDKSKGSGVPLRQMRMEKELVLE
jgi:hypothetical protein